MRAGVKPLVKITYNKVFGRKSPKLDGHGGKIQEVVCIFHLAMNEWQFGKEPSLESSC